jgi:hypothetical protein
MGDGERDRAEKKMQKSEKKFETSLDTLTLWCRILIKERGDRDGGGTSVLLTGKHPGGLRHRASVPPDQENNEELYPLTTQPRRRP